ncbi:MAG: crossover junction endodeoxyribonuclease RuvC [Patescibacteria group bacterium]
MLVLGIDPGTATTGWGLIESLESGFVVKKWGLIETSKENLDEVRLQSIHRQMLVLLDEHKPDVFAIEKVFFATNAKTAINVGQAIGVMLLSAASKKILVKQYAPGTIKKMVAGSGRADKKIVQQAVRKILGNQVKSEAHKKTHFDNAADALAIALCHVMMENGK